ncbi:hypothetical protein BG004_005440 [Podila humilis]|nr:hypothetical protein BG004_005440 [Podila humilis]
MNALPALSKDDPRTVSSKLSRHQSEGNYAQKTAGSSLTVESKTASIRKGIGRLKSPSRAPQQPLDLSTENLRRKLLGPGSIRKPVVDRVEPVYSIPPGLKSPSRRKFAAGNSRALNLSLGEIPDLTTMMIMKKKQNASLTIGPSPFEVDSDHRSLSPTSQMLTVMQSRANPTMQDNVEGITPPTRSNSLYASLKRIQDDQDVVHRRSSEKAHEIETLSRSHRFASLSKSRSVAGSSHSASLPTDLPSSSTKSVEARNKSTIQGLTRSILSKINIGTDHDDYKQCASNLYRSVKFAMRKDIATKVYHLEELERLMDRHAALL